MAKPFVFLFHEAEAIDSLAFDYILSTLIHPAKKVK